MTDEMKMLKKLCMPVVDYLKNNCHPHCEVNITYDGIYLTETIAGIPVEEKEETK